ncbi:MAG: DUF4855 domain-containing protein, partial [Clostridia bacterium]|nr:DUF4855 domain-containing protein [Clostridia bacterium]
MRFIKISVCILILLCMLLAACGGPAEQSAADESEQQPESVAEVSEKEGGESSEPEEPPKPTRVEQINAFVDFDAQRTGTGANVAQGMMYKSSRPTHEDYPDNNAKMLLTDGASPKSFDKNTWAGYYSRSHDPVDVTIDLGEVRNGIMDFHADVLNLLSYGISICSSVTVSAAGEDKEFVELGTVPVAADIYENEAYDFALKLQGAVSARYIKFSFAENSSVWLFVGELQVIAYGEEYSGGLPGNYVSAEKYYGFESVPVVTTKEYWDASEPDYNETKNIVSGITPMVFAGENITKDIATEWYNGTNAGILSDGETAVAASYSDSAWFHITRADSRQIVFDLGKTSEVSGFSTNLLKNPSAGVYPPRYILASVSENGTDWQTLSATSSVSSDKENDIIPLEINFGKSYKARYFRLSFLVDTHVYIDEISVTGRKNAEGALDVVPDAPTDKDSLGGSYILPSEFDNVHNILLSYHCYGYGNSHDEAGLITAEEYLPYVAYLDTEGNITDTLFDGFLYLPYTKFNYSTEARNADGWRFYVDDIYYPDRNMAALNEAVGQVKNALGKYDYKVAVYTSVLYTFQKTNEGQPNKFGDIDGDGVDEDITKLEDRKKAIKWIMDEEYARFRNGGYGNLDFKGFYWFEEHVDYSDPHELTLIRFASDYAHSLGVKLFWIPYHLASGYSDWKTLGFDMACMQPNYMFHADASVNVLYTNAEKTRLLGMCVEMELSGVTNRSNASKFEEYMIAGAQTGYMNSVKVYYQDGVPGAFSQACYSDDEFTRKVYDDLYLYAKEKLEVVKPEEITLPDQEIKLECESGKSVKGKIELGEYSAYAESLAVSRSPRYGTLQLNRDGSFVYTAPKDYSGTDSFAVHIDLGYVAGGDTSAEITIGG